MRGKLRVSRPLSKVTAVLLCFVLALLVFRFQFFARQWADFLVSVRFFAAGPVLHQDPIIIRIDDESIQQLGPWPWPRHLHADALRILDQEQPSVIGVDLLFQKPDPINDRELATALAELETPVVLGAELEMDIAISLRGQSLQSEGEHPSLFQKVPQGYLNLIQDRDGLIRAWPLLNDGPMPAFSERIYQSVTDQDPPPVGPAIINFLGNQDAFPSISFLELLEQDYPLDFFRSKIVLIGITTENTDRHRTSVAALGAVPGVYLHAYLIRNLLDENWLRPVSNWVSCLLLLGSAGLWAAIFPRRPSYVTLLLALGAGTTVLLLGIFAGFFGHILPIPALLVIVFLEPTVFLAQSYRKEREERQKVIDLFAKYVSPEILREISRRRHELNFSGEERFVAVFFSDIRDFTSLTAGQQPEQVIAEVNAILGQMTAIIHRHGGLVNKFLGDGIMAVFGIPLWEDSAIQSVFAACEEIVDLKGSIGGKCISLGIGLSWGMVTAGCVGNEDRLEYTVMGQPVNIAARLEGLAGPGEIVFSYDQRFELDFLKKAIVVEEVQVKGIDKSLTVGRMGGMEGTQ